MTETQNANRPGALIAMSGGVDSSVAAWLMQQKGYACTGITMRLTRNETLGQSGFHTCCSEKDIEDAAEVAYAMDIPYEVLDFTADFREKIIEKFIRVYEAGGTPNPCIDCNRYMKFDHLLSWAREHGMEYVVTGHYARVEQDEATGRWLLKKVSACWQWMCCMSAVSRCGKKSPRCPSRPAGRFMRWLFLPFSLWGKGTSRKHIMQLWKQNFAVQQ